MPEKRVHVWIEGRVQGVFFRANVQEMASSAGLSGWVRNLVDGRVEAVFEGPAESVERMVQWCWQGSSSSRVDTVVTKEEPLQGQREGFEIRYTR